MSFILIRMFMGWDYAAYLVFLGSYSLLLILSPVSNPTTGMDFSAPGTYCYFFQVSCLISWALYSFVRPNLCFDHLQALGSIPSTTNPQNTQTKAYQTKYIQTGARGIVFKFRFQNGRIERNICRAGPVPVLSIMLFLTTSYSHYHAVLPDLCVYRISFPSQTTTLTKHLYLPKSY